VSCLNEGLTWQKVVPLLVLEFFRSHSFSSILQLRHDV
jgi:hypothetical protein